MITCTPAILLLLLFSPLPLSAQPPAGEDKVLHSDETRNFRVIQVEGWEVYVNKRLLREKKHLGRKVLELLQVQLAQVAHAVPASRLEKLREVQPLDGVYFALHGAMVAEAPYTDAEGCLVREARGVLGDIPMVATYDFHAIMSDEEMASVVPFPNNTNPHIDGYERGLEAAGCLLKMLAGEIAPVTRRVFVPIIGPNIGQSTWSQIPEEERGLLLYDLNLRREELEKTPGIIDITILGGYGYADTPDTGMCIVATADGDAELAERMARQLAGELWRRREQLITVRPVYGIDDGVKEAMSRQ